MSSVTNRYPAPGDTDIPSRVRPTFTISDLADQALIDAWALVGTGREEQVVTAGQAAAGTHVEADGLGGFRVTVGAEFQDLETVSLRTTAPGLDETWSFTTSDGTGPYVSSATPPFGAIASSSPTVISLTIVDALDDVDPTTLQVYVDGEQIIEDGVDVSPGGWSAAIIDTGDLDVTINVPGANWSAGDTARVSIEVADDAGNLSVINGTFDVVDTRGPQITTTVPADGARGLGLTEDLIFDLTCSEGVDSTSIDIEINGVTAMTAGAGVGDWSTSTVTPITDGHRVTLKKPSGYADGDMVFVDITCADSIGREGERRVLRYQFGTTTGDQTVNHGLGGTVVRVIAYDLSETSFADPVPRRHTGYAYDGTWYENGSPTNTVASWYTELGEFPVSGHIVVTTTGWAIVEPLESSAWMTCLTLTSPDWSMAGTGTVTDADWGPEPVLFVASDVVVEIDFALDRARVYDTTGRDTSSMTIDDRALAQVGATVEDVYALPTGPYTGFAALRARASTVLALATSASLTVVHDLGTEWLSELVSGSVPPNVVTRSEAEWSSATWVRLRIEDEHLLLAYNDTEAQIELWSWFTFVDGGARELFLDPGTTPALPAGAIADLALEWPVALAAIGDQATVIDLVEESLENYGASVLGLTSGDLTALVLEKDFQADLGHLYASNANGVSRFSIRDQTAVLLTTIPASTLSSIGSTKHNVEVYVNASMEIV